MLSGSCKYGNEKCWFNHGDSKDSIEDENIKKTDTQQMVEMKEMNNLKWNMNSIKTTNEND